MAGLADILRAGGVAPFLVGKSGIGDALGFGSPLMSSGLTAALGNQIAPGPAPFPIKNGQMDPAAGQALRSLLTQLFHVGQ